MAISGCRPTNNQNGMWQNKTKINLKFPLFLAFGSARSVWRLTTSLRTHPTHQKHTFPQREKSLDFLWNKN